MGQVKSNFEARDSIMQKYLEKVKDQTFAFKYFNILHIPRAENAWADALFRLTVTTPNELG